MAEEEALPLEKGEGEAGAPKVAGAERSAHSGLSRPGHDGLDDHVAVC